MSIRPTPPTLFLVDPTAPDGETSLEMVRSGDDHLIVVVLMTGRSSNALHERAHHQQVSVSTAAWSYLDHVARRLDRPGRIVGTIAAAGPDPAYELAVIATEHDAERVVFPTSTLRIDRHAPLRLARLAPVRIEAPAVAVVRR